MPKFSNHRYIIYNAHILPRKGADFQESAWDDKMKGMIYDKLADAVNAAIRLKRIRNTEYSIYRQQIHGKGERDPIASTAKWALVDNMEWIDVGEYV